MKLPNSLWAFMATTSALLLTTPGVIVMAEDADADAVDATQIQVLGQSGKFRITNSAGASDPNAVTVEADYVYEFPYEGHNHGTWAMANQDFTVSGPTATEISGLQASLITFTSELQGVNDGFNYGTFQLDTYVLEESGTITTGTETYTVEAKDVKFNIVLSDWIFEDTSEFVDVGVIIKGRSDEPDAQGNNRFDLGGNVPLILSGSMIVDGVEQSMPSGYPQVNQTGNKYTFAFRFPRFVDTLVYDPTIEYSKAGTGGGGGDSGFCFSKDATVQVQHKGTVTMEDLQVGDSVWTGDNRYESVYAFGHKNTEQTVEYLQIYTQQQHMQQSKPLEITGNHLVFANGQQPVRADTIQVGDVLSTAGTVTKINTVYKQGMYMPLTESGSIMVDGVLASSYVSIAKEAPRAVATSRTYLANEHDLVHWWLAPYRMMCMGVSSKLCSSGNNNTNQEGILNWLVVGQSLAEFANDQSSFVQHLLGLPLFLVFVLLIFVERMVGSALAPSVLALGGAALVYKYHNRRHSNVVGDIKKTV